MRQFVKMRFETIKNEVGTSVVQLYINGEFVDEVETHSQLSVKEAKEFFRNHYKTGSYQD